MVFLSNSFWVFVAGRAIAGVGAGGMGVVIIILVLELTDMKHRGIWVGFYNAAYTVGVSMGGIIGGLALQSLFGWVCFFIKSCLRHAKI